MPKTQPFRYIAYFVLLPIFCGSFLAAIYNFFIIPSAGESNYNYYDILFYIGSALVVVLGVCIILSLLSISWRVRAKLKYVLEFFFFAFLSIICFFAFIALFIDPTTLFLGQEFPSKIKYATVQTRPIVFNNFSVFDVDDRIVLRNMRVVVNQGRIQQLGSINEIPLQSDADIIEGKGRMLLPGLIDAHVHLGLSGKLEPLYRSFFVEPLSKSMERNARLTIESGVTTIREMPDYFDSSFALKEAIEQGYMAGPKMIVSGRAIGQWGGYFGWPAFGHLVATPKEAQLAIVSNLEKGAEFVVVPTPSSTFLRAGERDISESTLGGAVSYAQSRDVDVTAHVMWSNGASLAVEKGINGLEHMPSIMDPLKKNLMDTILRESIYVVPTIFMYTNFNQIANDPEAINNPEYKSRFGGSYRIASEYAEEYNGLTASQYPEIRKSKQVLDRAVTSYFQKNFQRMAKAGVIIGVGTGAGDMLMPHGWVSKELEKYVEYGMSPTEALVAATYTNAYILRKEKEIGRVKEEYAADLLVVEGDPTVNIQDIRNVKMVFKDGVKVFDEEGILKPAQR